MTDHTPMSKVARLEVISTGARRRWTLEEKQRIVAESFGAPRCVSETARRNGLSASQLFTWRRLARQGRLAGRDEAPGFVAAMIADDGATCTRLSNPSPSEVLQSSPVARSIGTPGRIEIVLVCGRRVIVDADIDAAVLARVLTAAEQT